MKTAVKKLIEIYARYLDSLERLSFQERNEIKEILKKYKESKKGVL